MTSRAFRTDLDAHKPLIWSFARKGFARALALQLPLEVEDVFQQMCETYVKARAKWSPDRGVSFSAYLGRAIWNEWNKYVDRLAKDPARLSIEDVSSGGSEDDSFCLLDVIGAEEAWQDPVELRVDAEQALEKIRPMSRLAKLVIAELLCEPCGRITTASVAQKHGFAMTEVKKARKEMREAWGLSI